MTTDFFSIDKLNSKIITCLERIYPQADQDALARLCLNAMGDRITDEATSLEHLWSERDCLLITYGNSIRDHGNKPLVTLQAFLHNQLKDIFSAVHVLPFFPHSSDDGFAVMDYLQVDPELGDWKDINALSNHFKLMADLVINHVSSQSQWFRNFLYGKDPGQDYFIDVDPNLDLSMVVRPRTSRLLRPVETSSGIRHVWCTFSDDQVDLNFRNSKVLLEFLRIIARYLEEGIQWIRLDAVAFLWKEPGTRCIHLPQTHEIIKLLRLLIEYKNARALLITETNVPNHENLSYFGSSNEAHIIYNFSLPPLLLHALMSGDVNYLQSWMMSMPTPPTGCTYLNFTASHDGIGLRPAEGLLSDGELNTLLDTMKKFGGQISSRNNSEGIDQPYEINISLFDAMRGTYKGEDQWQIRRFICSQTIMMALQGIPAFYIHSLFATPNDEDKLQATQQNRSINRKNWDYRQLTELLADPESVQHGVFHQICKLIRIRNVQPAFHPNAIQFLLYIKPEIFAFWRQSVHRSQSIFCLNNLSDIPQPIDLAEINLIETGDWINIIKGQLVEDINGTLVLEPYECAWLAHYA
ncbi:MAG TPA: alpha-amylase family glycosyl hydrolase [Gammaproteobacteria bacterium]